MGEACSTYEKNKNSYRMSVGKPDRNEQLQGPRRIWTEIKMDRKKKRRGDVDWIILAQDRDFCKYAIGNVGSMK